MSNAQKRQPKLSSPVFKTGDYIALAILIMQDDGRAVNYHLPQKLFAIKDFTQVDMMQAYHFQHPQQPVYIDQQRPDIGMFNSAVCNLHNWLIKNGYARQEGAADLAVHIWTPEEVKAHHDQLKAEHDARVLAHAESMTAGGDDAFISQGVNNLLGAASELNELGTKLYAEGSLGKEEHTPVNVGTVGHIDHGKSALASMVDRVTPTEPVEAGIPESYLEQKAAVVEMQDRAPDELELLYPADMELIQEQAVRTPQYPAIDAPADLMEPQSVKGE